MLPDSPPPDIISSIIAFLVTLLSCFISVTRRIIAGHPTTVLWICCEFATAILCGYLMYDAYPALAEVTPDWFTLPIAIAVSAHIGGRIFQEMEGELIRRYHQLINHKNP